MVATGRSSMWWLRNQALPRTQAFLALVILWPSTVSSMSSHTQPQKVQVAFSTTFSSVADIDLSPSPPQGGGNVQLLTDVTSGVYVDLPVTWHWRPLAI